ncbi:Hypothetical protein PHPALM_17236 [Phytophthora palmivora]|uniref:PiggyBac transposable element-derived protein domain-containing protein n=1 Tax=Phytophthora palmivora TaxID=4796 RepID=A0A2P4XMR4_9STRA|nr:Hypothetical protein PHPALM_17236 [Phytophthora palmivora]
MQWIESQFQNCVESLSFGLIQRGIDNYKGLMRETPSQTWQKLLECDDTEAIVIDDASDLQEAEMYEVYDPMESLPTCLDEVETIRSMRFERSASSKAPPDLYQHKDGSTASFLRPEYKHILHEKNAYAVAYEIKITQPFTLEELMKFWGMMFFMALNDKGEYANYWALNQKI